MGIDGARIGNVLRGSLWDLGLKQDEVIGVDYRLGVEVIIPRAVYYAGAWWSALYSGFGSGVEALEVARDEPVPVRRHLEPTAKHCETCPGKARTYSSWEAMLRFTGGVPADGSDQCVSECRCSIEFFDPIDKVFRDTFGVQNIPIAPGFIQVVRDLFGDQEDLSEFEQLL